MPAVHPVHVGLTSAWRAMHDTCAFYRLLRNVFSVTFTVSPVLRDLTIVHFLDPIAIPRVGNFPFAGPHGSYLFSQFIWRLTELNDADADAGQRRFDFPPSPLPVGRYCRTSHVGRHVNLVRGSPLDREMKTQNCDNVDDDNYRVPRSPSVYIRIKSWILSGNGNTLPELIQGNLVKQKVNDLVKERACSYCSNEVKNKNVGR